MTPAERELLVLVAETVRRMLAEEWTGVMVSRRANVKLLDAKLEALREDQSRPPGPPA